MGLEVPEVAQAGGGLRARRPLRRPRLHLRPAADAQGRAASPPARSVARSPPRRRYACAQQCALNAIAAVRAEIGDLSPGHAGREGRRLRRLAPPTSPVSRGSPTAPPSCSARSSATPACTPARRSASPSLPLDAPVEVELARRGLAVPMRIPLPPVPLPERAGRARREFVDGSREPVEPRNAATVVLLRDPPRPARRSTCCAARSRWSSPAAWRSSPAAASTAATSTPPSAGRARRPPSGPRGSAATRRWPGRWCAPRCARPSRSRACCWPVSRPTRSSPTPPATTGRPTGWRWSRASCR